jgi:hypothetical protein
MNKKIVIVVALCVILVITFIVSSINPIDEKLLSSTFVVSAVYYDNIHMVKIIYLDRSNKTSTVTLEVEGLDKSFQKKYTVSSFEEDLPLSNSPQYGWQTLPVTFLLDHIEFGKIIIKTEITPYGQLPAKIVYGRP